MAKSRKFNMGNGGIMGSGIFGMFGSVVKCDANDTSFFCTLTKIVSMIFMIIFLLVIAYLIYTFARSFSVGKSFKLFS